MVEIMTIGYEGLTQRKFLDLVRRCGVDRIIDVRELAVSRRVGFSKNALSNFLEKAGISIARSFTGKLFLGHWLP